MSVSINLKTGQYGREVDAFIRRNNKDFQAAMKHATNEMHKMAKKKVRQQAKGIVRSGHLVNEIHQKIINRGFTGEVISHASYSQAFEDGTRPHIIRIKNKPVLAGPKRGAPAGWKGISGDYAVYGKAVRHPGTEPHPFMYPAWLWGVNQLEKRIKMALN